MQQKTQFKGVVMLLLTALIWGSAFVAQSVGMDNVGAFTFSSARTIIGVLVLLPFVLIREFRTGRHMTQEQLKARRVGNIKTLKCGMILGILFCAAGNFQQYAFNYSTSGKIAFVTALYMFFVPVFGLFFGKRVSLLTWLCIAAGLVGLYLLCITPGDHGAVNFGDVLAFICAILYAVHILAIERMVSDDIDGLKLSVAQYISAGLLSTILMLIFEHPSFAAVFRAALPILYAGVMSTGVAYTFQIIGQKYTEATVASLLMCMESVFAVICGAILLGEKMSGRELIGCGIMFAAIIASQLTGLKKDNHELQ